SEHPLPSPNLQRASKGGQSWEENPCTACTGGRMLPAQANAKGLFCLNFWDLHGSVTVLCPSGDTQGDHKRFWCKVGRRSCTLIASSDGYVGRRYQGRIVITPQDSSGASKVLINDLKKEDSGLYLCGTQGPRGQDSLQEVVLLVATGDSKPNLTLVFHLPSSSGEPRLLPAVLPALLLLICITITILTLVKIKLQKQTGKLARNHLLGWQWLFWFKFARAGV
uniref:Immunoglobulin V-set domain-containing protein n=1 Tax=Cyanistes caeruleus TaxID=156563 RepID=A0A8C0V4W0_CYACU